MRTLFEFLGNIGKNIKRKDNKDGANHHFIRRPIIIDSIMYDLIGSTS